MTHFTSPLILSFFNQVLAQVKEKATAYTYILTPEWRSKLESFFGADLSEYVALTHADISFIQEKDPALKYKEATEVLLYKSLTLTFLHRLAHQLYNEQETTLARLLSEINREITGAEIHPGVKIGHSIFIDHPFGFIVGESAIIGNRFHGHGQVLLGSDGLNAGALRHPTIGDDVTIWPKASILGYKIIGKGAQIGCNAVVTEDVLPHSVVVGYNRRLNVAA